MGARTRRLLGRWAVPAALAVALTSVVTPLSAAAPTVSTQDPPAAVIPQRYLDQKATWDECSFDAGTKNAVPAAPTTRCTHLVVPMDWRHPDAHPDIRLAVAWSRATGTTHGLLTLNPGGPGVDALEESTLLATEKPRLFQSYDIMGFDPRGYGESQQVACLAVPGQQDRLATVPDPRIRSVKAHQVEVADAKFYGEACSHTVFSQFVSTQQTVYDMEFLRRYLGRDAPAYDKFNFVGVSYGTWLGAWYADTYPSHTGRFLLDSNMNWSSTMYANQVTDSFSFERRRDLMFFPWVARHNDLFGFGRTTAAVRRNYDGLRAGLSRAALRGDAIENPADFDDIVAVNLFADEKFFAAMDYISYVDESTPGGALARPNRDRKLRKPASALRVQAALRRYSAARPTPVSTSRSVGPLEEIETTDSPVRCNDSAFSRDLATQLKRADADAKKYPFLGYFNTLTMCNYWRYAPVARTIDLAGAPTLLMIQAEGDPATAYEGGLAAHRATAAHTRLVSVDNEGEHGIYSYGVSPCVDKIGDAFLLDGKLPGKDTVCGTSPMPKDTKVYPLVGPLDGKSYALDAQARSLSTRQAKVHQQRLASKLDVAASSLH